MSWLALDIGGANLKAADGHGFAVSRPFALWKHPAGLADQLRSLIDAAPASEQIAVTMTGELADCYPSRQQGVAAIATAVKTAAQGTDVFFYRTDGQLAPWAGDDEWPLLAASNWHALARWALRLCGGEAGLLIDVGSTTADIIPLGPQGVAATGRDDYDRLRAGELVYTGVVRTPVCALLEAAELGGHQCPVAAELFATAADAYLTLGLLPEDAEDCDTADGRARTRAAAQARLGRMVCREIDAIEAESLAHQIHLAQLQKLEQAAQAVLQRTLHWPGTVILAGQGEFLAEAILPRIDLAPGSAHVISLTRELGPDVARCAPAHALAVLAAEKQP
ncbi:MAG: H4MPT-linked C1 transfer pathway protein [Planctomycetaceae bacterium]|nr:H4MPT-linked C1 transfer pathway protein [Planctomycetaceae bacterium]